MNRRTGFAERTKMFDVPTLRKPKREKFIIDEAKGEKLINEFRTAIATSKTVNESIVKAALKDAIEGNYTEINYFT